MSNPDRGNDTLVESFCNCCLADMLEHSEAVKDTPEHRAEAVKTLIYLRDAVSSSLSEVTQQKIKSLVVHLHDVDGFSLDKTGDVIGLSYTRVHQIYNS